MKTPNFAGWLDLSYDLITSIFERLSFTDFNRAKLVCSKWYHISQQCFPMKTRSPWLMLFQDNNCVLYNPVEDKIYIPTRDFLGIRVLASSGKWFLVLDSLSNLYIIDTFSENKIDLPPLESLKSCNRTLERVGDKEFKWKINFMTYTYVLNTDVLKGLLSVDEKNKDFVVVWFSDKNLAFCKKGDDHYTEIRANAGICRLPQGVAYAVIHGYLLYVVTNIGSIRLMDFSSRDKRGYTDFTLSTLVRDLDSQTDKRIAVRTSSGEILLVENNLKKTWFVGIKSFRLYEMSSLVEVDSLGDEALFLDLGITVPANETFGIEPNSIYFTFPNCMRLNLEICVYNIATKTIKRLSSLFNMTLKDARWFLSEI